MTAKKRSIPARKAELEAMSLDELWSLHEHVNRMLSSRISAEKVQLEKRLAVLHQGIAPAKPQNGLISIAGSKTPRKYPRVPPKYQNPQSPSETWSGRGKLPRWLVAAVKTGRKIEEFRIVDPDEASKERHRA